MHTEEKKPNQVITVIMIRSALAASCHERPHQGSSQSVIINASTGRTARRLPQIPLSRSCDYVTRLCGARTRNSSASHYLCIHEFLCARANPCPSPFNVTSLPTARARKVNLLSKEIFFFFFYSKSAQCVRQFDFVK